MKTAENILRLACYVLMLLIMWALFNPQAYAQIPEDAYKYKRIATATYQDVFGLDAPIATLAAQIHQESLWQHDAQSPFAGGLAQFTPPTAKDMARWYQELRPFDPYDPRQALRAQALYMKRLMAKYDLAEYQMFAFGLSGYNGGQGWTNRDQRICAVTPGCNPNKWFDHVELYSRRADWAIRENRHYVSVILRRHQYKYRSWGRFICD